MFEIKKLLEKLAGWLDIPSQEKTKLLKIFNNFAKLAAIILNKNR